MAHDHCLGNGCVQFPGVFQVVGVAEEDPTLKRFGKQACYRDVLMMSVEQLLNVPGLDAVMVETDELSLVHAAQNVLTGVFMYTLTNRRERASRILNGFCPTPSARTSSFNWRTCTVQPRRAILP